MGGAVNEPLIWIRAIQGIAVFLNKASVSQAASLAQWSAVTGVESGYKLQQHA
jgi:hypothetical protein